ncbi:MAG: hypothetical protein WCD54_24390 [Pseudolabrys sp.]
MLTNQKAVSDKIALYGRPIWKIESLTWNGLSAWLVGLLIDLVAVAFGIGGALFVAGDYYRLSAVEGPVVFAFFVAMLATNFICRKVASWCLD